MIKSLLYRRAGLGGAGLAVLLLVQLLLASTAFAENNQMQSTPASYRIKGVPLYAQQHNLSCEYASARMVTAYWGRAVSESQFIRNIPVNPNPHLGFRGNIDGVGGGLTNYGIYAEPIANYLEEQGFNTRVFYGDANALRQEIAQGHPVMVWLTIALQYATPRQVVINGTAVKLVPGEHSVVVTGYDEGGVYLNGPAQGIRVWYRWADFLRSWSYFDQMALSIWT
jgi:uncharacterized protein YvpB